MVTRFTALSTASTCIAVSLPAGRTPEEGLPLAIQLIARHSDDALLMALAGQYERLSA